MKPQVSVIVTVYNRIDFLRQAIEGAIAQTFLQREIIVVDDSGTATASEICKPFVAAGHIRYLPNLRNLGIAGSIRRAMEDARGEFISILNDDDLWEPNFLSRLTAPLQTDSERVLAFSDHWIISDDGSIDHRETEANTRHYGRSALSGGDLKDPDHFVLVQNGVPLAMASVFRKETVDLALLTDEVSGAYDFWISCILAASNGKFYYVPQRLTRYRAHSESETARRDPRKAENQVYIFSQLLEHNWFPRMRHYLKSRLAGAFFRLGRDRLYFNSLRDARHYFFKSLRTQPSWRPIVAILLSLLPRLLRVQLKLSSSSKNGRAETQVESS